MKMRNLVTAGLLEENMVACAIREPRAGYKPSMRNVSTLTYWLLQGPNLILVALIVLLAARLLLGAVFSNVSAIVRGLAAVTRPVTAVVGAITPRIIPPAGVVACAIAWLVAARVVLTMVALGLGVRLWG
jgi:hypothetical protein